LRIIIDLTLRESTAFLKVKKETSKKIENLDNQQNKGKNHNTRKDQKSKGEFLFSVKITKSEFTP
jgi:hypothetical protein